LEEDIQDGTSDNARAVDATAQSFIQANDFKRYKEIKAFNWNM